MQVATCNTLISCNSMYKCMVVRDEAADIRSLRSRPRCTAGSCDIDAVMVQHDHYCHLHRQRARLGSHMAACIWVGSRMSFTVTNSHVQHKVGNGHTRRPAINLGLPVAPGISQQTANGAHGG